MGFFTRHFNHGLPSGGQMRREASGKESMGVPTASRIGQNTEKKLGIDNRNEDPLEYDMNTMQPKMPPAEQGMSDMSTLQKVAMILEGIDRGIPPEEIVQALGETDEAKVMQIIQIAGAIKQIDEGGPDMMNEAPPPDGGLGGPMPPPPMGPPPAPPPPPGGAMGAVGPPPGPQGGLM